MASCDAVRQGAEPQRRVGYVCSRDLLLQADRIQNVKNRASMVHALISAYRLPAAMRLLPARPAEEEELADFHSSAYVEYLRSAGGASDLDGSQDEDYGLGFDCPRVTNMLDLALTLAGGSLTAARALCSAEVDVAINWCGGWHHAQRDSASGFCYVNDVVLAINQLRTTFDRVLYVDLDIHHGDGVENAFMYSPRVFTFSIHHFEDGYFPGTGDLDDVGCGRGRYYSCNVPLREGTTDDSFVSAFDRTISPVLAAFRPHALVVQCGADCLAGDPLGTFSLTPGALVRCGARLLAERRPTLLLGGGGYHAANAARCWAQLTALTVGRRLPSDIPEHAFLMHYGPSFELELSPGLRKDCNTREEMEEIVQSVTANMKIVASQLQ